MVSEGQKYRALTNIELTCMTSWSAPYTGGYERVFPLGEEFIIENDPPEGATAVYANPCNYDKLHEQLIPLQDRKQTRRYQGYYLCINIADIENKCELIN